MNVALGILIDIFIPPPTPKLQLSHSTLASFLLRLIDYVFVSLLFVETLLSKSDNPFQTIEKGKWRSVIQLSITGIFQTPQLSMTLDVPFLVLG